MKRNGFVRKTALLSLAALSFARLHSKESENKAVTHHQSFHSFSSVKNNNNEQNISQAYYSTVHIGKRGLLDYIKKQLNTATLNDQKEILIGKLSGDNDLPEKLINASSPDGSLYYVMLLINGSSIKLAFSCDEEAIQSYSIEYNISEKNFDQALNSLKSIDGTEHKKQFDTRVTECGGAQNNIEKSLQESFHQMREMRRQFDDMQRSMEQSFGRLSSFFFSEPSVNEQEADETPRRHRSHKIAGTNQSPIQHRQATRTIEPPAKKRSCWKPRQSRVTRCPHCHKCPQDPIEESE